MNQYELHDLITRITIILGFGALGILGAMISTM